MKFIIKQKKLLITMSFMMTLFNFSSEANEVEITSPFEKINNNLAKTPPMGWSSWNQFGVEISEQLIIETIDAMVRNGMRDAGYNYVNLDDGYPLKTNEIEFLTPEYSFKIKTTSKENFLQLYTPDKSNVIAIEPMTGAADNFNNKIGLQTLLPNDILSVEWNLAIKNLTLK